MQTTDLSQAIGIYSQNHNHVIKLNDDNYEIATFFIDSYGDTIYCFVEADGPYYQVSDDGRMLFKLDPGFSDQELLQTAKEIVIGAGFDFDDQTATIHFTTTKEDLAQVIIKLAQLQVAISYLG